MSDAVEIPDILTSLFGKDPDAEPEEEDAVFVIGPIEIVKLREILQKHALLKHLGTIKNITVFYDPNIADDKSVIEEIVVSVGKKLFETYKKFERID